MSDPKEMTIEEVRNRFKDEWVLVEVLREDELQRPQKVRLIIHSKRREEIYEALKEHKDYTYQFYTGKIPKKGYAVAFYG
jgi:hypothetical protein